ncbi:DUF3095 domain-containing protein [Hoeflea poritis]|uniref:DUF3095 domain-containing protein n=1 Tax=Hoeflea poritis TaxID=2993659 RepID=A0ABT4VV26_9HYPH|nr:DUF3095 domain-containing protein [Hoeflea poritis]MDA4848484.1 DUF3095 domain-containing protein [Hoeflea poritis]
MTGRPQYPVLTQFEQVADGSLYVPLPADWKIGSSDVVNSTAAIAAGQYKTVNFAGAATISAVSNALGGNLPLFVFGGDGAQFAVSPQQAGAAAEALDKVRHWVKRELGLDLRVGMTGVSDIRKAGADVCAAYWQASDHVRYSMFTGGGLEWAEKQLKAGRTAVAASTASGDPDLTGLSCQWGPVLPTQGKIVSLIVKPAPGAAPRQFEKAIARIIAALANARAVNPVPEAGPDVRWPAGSIGLQSRIGRGAGPRVWRNMSTLFKTLFYWALFKAALPLRDFLPDRYRADIAANSDFRKFSDGLMMTVDCPPEAVDALTRILDKNRKDGTIRYGLEMQDEALITCVVPSAFDRDHMHFIDGSGGGYASAARQLRSEEFQVS